MRLLLVCVSSKLSPTPAGGLILFISERRALAGEGGVLGRFGRDADAAGFLSDLGRKGERRRRKREEGKGGRGC
jgi:hypothetical protein